MSFHFHYEPATNAKEARTLVLLHGTGGTERDLVSLGKDLLPGAAIISPRGKVNEHGMSRWFRRFAEGVFDEADMSAQADDLADFLKGEGKGDGEGKNLVALGYSNGANMGAALMTFHPEVLTGLIMWRGMSILREQPTPDLAGKKILMINGLTDQMGPIESARNQAEHFRRCGADMTAHELGTGHGLTQADFSLTQEWLKSSFE
jgi:phospholipase/carboxylesterase